LGAYSASRPETGLLIPSDYNIYELRWRWCPFGILEAPNHPMALFHHITVFLISEEQKASFADLGVVFTDFTRGPRGESASFDIGEDDPRWEKVVALIGSLKERDGIPKEHRVQDLSMTAPWDELMRRLKERTAALKRSQPGPMWLDGYSGQSVDQLLSLEGKYRIDSLVVAFEQAIGQKAQRGGVQSLTDEERVVLAVEALEREVNNGGYDQFFVNSSREFAPTIVGALKRIGCKLTASITQRAIAALGVSELTSEAIDAAMAADNEQRLAKLNRCDDLYYKNAEPIAERLFAFIKANKAGIRF
jgi:hypothetical protein